MEIEWFVGSRLEAKRRERGLSQAALSEALDVAESEIQGWEAGRVRVPPEAVVELASVLGCEPSYFFVGFADSTGVEPAAEVTSQTAQSRRAETVSRSK